MNKNKILVIDDELPVRNFLFKAITSFEYEVTLATNGVEALEIYIKNPFPVIITDLNMPLLNGEELIDKINCLENIPKPTILVLTSEDDIAKVVGIMKKEVFDYLLKPVNTKDLNLKLKNAFKVFELNKVKQLLEKEKELRLQEQLSWIKYKEELKDRDSNKFKNNLILNLKHSLGQAGGFGALVSLTDLIYMSAVQDGENFIISKEIMDLIKENASILKRTLEAMEKISSISDNSANLEKISILDFYNILERTVEENKEIISIKNNNLILSDRKANFATTFINANTHQIKEVLNEIIINACKFSDKSSQIFILCNTKAEFFSFSLLNKPSPEIEILGIPDEYSNLVFEPFYRISKFVDDAYNTLNLGIGLSLVKAVIKKHNGDVRISNIKDFTARSGDTVKVNLEIELPIIE